METALRDRTVGELASSDHRFAGVFHSYGIDFCCGGKKSVAAACAGAGVAVDEVERDLERVSTSGGPSAGPDVRSWSGKLLADYIVEVHHGYVRTSAPVVAQFAEKVARVHGQTHPETVAVERLAMALLQDLTSHMAKEEGVLFPYIADLSSVASGAATRTSAPFGSARNPIAMMEHEHEQVGELLRDLRETTNGYTPPPDACNSYRFLYAKLAEFEADLHQHIHLENNILFPKALELERSLAA